MVIGRDNINSTERFWVNRERILPDAGIPVRKNIGEFPLTGFTIEQVSVGKLNTDTSTCDGNAGNAGNVFLATN